jgi:site-specific DNA recombinase
LPDIKASQFKAFSQAPCTKLLDKEKGLGKAYLKLLASEIRVNGNQAAISGSYSALTHAVAGIKRGTSDKVPGFVLNWLPEQGSNL